MKDGRSCIALGYPAELYCAGPTDADIYGLGTINGLYPERMQYGTGAYSKDMVPT
ncbi:MAG: hypothetical protein R2758_05185 [Bacteroidales bacterium]